LREKTTDGPVGIGTRYREVVQMAPVVRSEILSEVTRYEQYSVLEERWSGGGMEGTLTYFFIAVGQGTELRQHVEIGTHWLLRLFDPVIARMYARAARYRLECIKAIWETGRSPELQRSSGGTEPGPPVSTVTLGPDVCPVPVRELHGRAGQGKCWAMNGRVQR